jgi:hypothetical protein
MVVISVSPSGLPGSLSDAHDDAARAVPAQSTDRPVCRLTWVSTDRGTPGRRALSPTTGVPPTRWPELSHASCAGARPVVLSQLLGGVRQSHVLCG